jgi:hypothetical protein
MRVSQTVKRMMDEDADYTKGKKTGKAGDVELLNKDTEIVFR